MGAIRADMCYVYRGIVGGEIVSLYLRISSSVTVDAMPYVMIREPWSPPSRVVCDNLKKTGQYVNLG